MGDWSQAPFSATDVLAGVEAFLGLLYLALWRRDRETGMGWLAISALCLALWIGTNEHHVPHGPAIPATWWWVPMHIGLAALCLGLVDYLGAPPRWRLHLLIVLLAPVALSQAAALWVQATGAVLPRAIVVMVTTTCFAGLGALAFWAARREPGAGHACVGAALLSIPALAIVLAATGSPAVAVRYWGFLPLLALGLTLLTVSLLRRRRKLEAEVERRARAEQALLELNASLEAKVARRTQDLHAMVAALETFNRNVSHDLRGPLGGIGSLARLSEQALLQGDTRRALELLAPISRQADSLLRLMSALLALARNDDGPLNPEPVDLSALVADVCDVLSHSPPDVGHMPAIEIGTLPTVVADPDLLRAALTNLIGNAVKFTAGRQDGLVQISARPDNDAIALTVRDNGIGFDAALGARLFQPFVRLHGQQYSGHGIGLSIVRRAVEKHGGSVQAEGRPGQGATFTITLPHVPLAAH